MGVIHKLTPQVKEFILEKKQVEPALSCRAITSLVSDKFKIKLSKSSANSLFKQAGLSMPAGRSRSLNRPGRQALYSGLVFFKAADSMLGATFYISQILKRLTKDIDALAQTENLLEHYIRKYILAKEDFPPQLYTKRLDADRNLLSEIAQALKDISQEARYIKVRFSDGKEFYLDGQLHTVWPSSRLPAGFSLPIYSLENYLNRHFKPDEPFVLFFAPGYKQPSGEFFDFLRSFSSGEKGILQLTFYNHQDEEVKKINIAAWGGRNFIFGIWPWQFKEHIKVSIAQEFRQFNFAPLEKDFYLSPAEVQLRQPQTNRVEKLNGCLLKSGVNEKSGLIILSNLSAAKSDIGALAEAYLQCWPNPGDSFQNFSRVSEAFSRGKNLPEKGLEGIFSEDLASQAADALFNSYLRLLELCIKRYFLPIKYSKEMLATVKEGFYRQETSVKKTKQNIFVSFKLAVGCPFLKDIEYACARINERQIIMPDARRLWLKALSAGRHNEIDAGLS